MWKFYNKIAGHSNSGKCSLCQKIIKSSGNTTNLIGHIKNIHKAAFRELNSECGKNSKIDSSTIHQNAQLVFEVAESLQSTSSAGVIEFSKEDII